MGSFKITAAIGDAIRAAKKAGGSDRAIARQIQAEFGVSLSHRAVGIYLSRAPAKPPGPPQTNPGSREIPPEGELDPIETLRARARDLNNALLAGVEPRLWPAFNAELRQTFNSIAKAEKAKRDATTRAGADVTWVMAKLRKFDSMNKTGGAAAEDGEAGKDIPPAARATGSS